MAIPVDVTPLGLQLYEACEPLAVEDEQNDYALLRYLDALVQGGQQSETYGRDTGDVPGWGILMSPTTVPPEALQWLSQFAGANLAVLRKSVNILQSQLILNPNFNHDALGTHPAAWRNQGTVSATVFHATEGWEAGRIALEIQSGTMAVGKTTQALGCGGFSIGLAEELILVKELEHYTFLAKVKVGSVTGKVKITWTFNWVTAAGEPLSTTTVDTFSTVGVHTTSFLAEAPAAAVGVEVLLTATSEEAGSKVTMFADEVVFMPSPEGTILPYGDGDQPGWIWLEEVGDSQQELQATESDEEFAEAQRLFVAEEAGTKRGTPAAILAAAKRYLTGSKNAFLVERDGGAYRLTVVTYDVETPNKAQVKAAIEEQVPAGIVLKYATVPGATYILIHASYSTYEELGIGKVFKTYNGLRNNIPGT